MQAVNSKSILLLNLAREDDDVRFQVNIGYSTVNKVWTFLPLRNLAFLEGQRPYGIFVEHLTCLMLRIDDAFQTLCHSDFRAFESSRNCVTAASLIWATSD